MLSSCSLVGSYVQDFMDKVLGSSSNTSEESKTETSVASTTSNTSYGTTTSTTTNTVTSTGTTTEIVPGGSYTVNFVNMANKDGTAFKDGTQLDGSSNVANKNAFVEALNGIEFEGLVTNLNAEKAKFNKCNDGTKDDIYLVLGSAKADGYLEFTLGRPVVSISCSIQRYYNYVSYSSSLNIDSNSAFVVASGNEGKTQPLSSYTAGQVPSVETFTYTFNSSVETFKLSTTGAGGNGYSGTENDSARVLFRSLTFNF